MSTTTADLVHRSVHPFITVFRSLPFVSSVTSQCSGVYVSRLILVAGSSHKLCQPRVVRVYLVVSYIVRHQHADAGTIISVSTVAMTSGDNNLRVVSNDL